MYTIPNHISTSLSSSSSSSPIESTIIIDANAKKLNNLNIVEQKLKSEQIMENIRNEAKRLIKRKQLTITKPTVTTSTAITAQKDIPLFSIEQVSQIVVKMMKEREEALHEQYQLKLTEKLSEQYSTFVKFTHEQIQKRFETSNFSYVS